MKKWKVILEVSDDGISDTGTGDFLSDEEIKLIVLGSLAMPAGISINIVSIESDSES